LHRGQARRNGADGEHGCPAVASDPERRVPGGSPLVTAPGDEQQRTGCDKRTRHLRAFERTAFGSVARTRPRCLPTQTRPSFVFTLRPSTRRRAPVAKVETPWSFC